MTDYSHIYQSVQSERFQIWHNVLRDLDMTAEPDHTVLRFPNSSTYIFSTGLKLHWMMDPSFETDGTCTEELRTIANMIRSKIAFILITHLHGDHCQKALVRLLADANITWCVPQSCLKAFLELSPIPQKHIIALDENESTCIDGISITARPGFHFDPSKNQQVPSGSYDITLPDGIRLFFPADVRDYSAPISDLAPVDYTFGHVFLGREDATGNEFSLLDPAAKFFCKRPGKYLLLSHLYEISREPKDMWTRRHAAMLRDRINAQPAHPQTIIPHRGDIMHLVKDQDTFQDPLEQCAPEANQSFLDLLGVSIKKNHVPWMEQAIEDRIPVVEWMHSQAAAVPEPILLSQLRRWREKGGACLSIHFPDFPLPGQASHEFQRAIELAIACQANRVTIHVPGLSIAEMQSRFDEMTAHLTKLCAPLLDNGLHIGIENLHTKPQHSLDEKRPFGFIPQECIQLVNALRRKSNSTLFGVHLDIGHAYSNPPFNDTYDTQRWLDLCADLLNGMHIHQFEHATTPDESFLEGHKHFSSRTSGHPSILPLLKKWAQGLIRVPIILEVMRGPEPSPFDSLKRLRSILNPL